SKSPAAGLTAPGSQELCCWNCLSCRGALCFLNFALDLEAGRRKVGVVGFQQEGIEAAPMFDRLQGPRRDAQTKLPATERVADQRDVAEVRAEFALRLVLRVAPELAGQRQGAGELAAPGH